MNLAVFVVLCALTLLRKNKNLFQSESMDLGEDADDGPDIISAESARLRQKGEDLILNTYDRMAEVTGAPNCAQASFDCVVAGHC